MKESYYFGIDGGGTHSRLALVNQAGKILARTEAGSTNIYSVKKEEVYENLSSLLDSALKESGLKKGDLKAGCLGSAGVGREGERRIFREFFDTLLSPETPVKLCTDGEILLCGGLGSLEGYCLIAGTGSVALGRSADGRLVRAGGLGYMLGDEGAAAWIGKTAIARSLRSLEKRDLSTAMMPAILEACKLEQSSDLIRFVHHDADKAKVAALAPVVTAAARKGDPLALDILRTGAAELVLLVRSVQDQSPWIKNRALVLAGGVIEHDEILTGALRESLSGEFPYLSVGSPKGSALEGACMLAKE
ncbi:N-acetylmuramic acid/N-acetylglucosamine kinase [Spirochaetia bacterium]|nr:N-acetylmuramic acid/N-acetylglucosamine kinase [Spirochaetia bacterium]